MNPLKIILITGILITRGALAQSTPVDGVVSKTVNIIDAFNPASEVEEINIYGFVNVTSNVSWEIDFSNDVDHVVGGFNLADPVLNANIQSLFDQGKFTVKDCGNALGGSS